METASEAVIRTDLKRRSVRIAAVCPDVVVQSRLSGLRAAAAESWSGWGVTHTPALDRLLLSRLRGVPLSAPDRNRSSQPGEPVLCLNECGSVPGTGAHLLCDPPGAAVRPELVPGLDPRAEGAVPAGPAGESRARESVHPPGFPQYSPGKRQTAQHL